MSHGRAALFGSCGSRAGIAAAVLLALILAAPAAAQTGDPPPGYTGMARDVGIDEAGPIPVIPPINPFTGVPVDDVDVPTIREVSRYSIQPGPLLAEWGPDFSLPGSTVINGPIASFFQDAIEIEVVTVVIEGGIFDCPIYCETVIVERVPGAVGFADSPQIPDFLVGGWAFSAVADDTTTRATYGQATEAGEVTEFINPHGILTTDLGDGVTAFTWFTPGPRELVIATSGLLSNDISGAWAVATAPIPFDPNREILSQEGLGTMWDAAAFRAGDTGVVTPEADPDTAVDESPPETDDGTGVVVGESEETDLAPAPPDDDASEATAPSDDGSVVGLVLGLLALGLVGVATTVWLRNRGDRPDGGAGEETDLSGLLASPEEQAKDQLLDLLDSDERLPAEVDWGELETEWQEDEPLTFPAGTTTARVVGAVQSYMGAVEHVAGLLLTEAREMRSLGALVDDAVEELVTATATVLTDAVPAFIGFANHVMETSIERRRVFLAGLEVEAELLNQERTPQQIADGVVFTAEMLEQARGMGPAMEAVEEERDLFAGLHVQGAFLGHFFDDVVSGRMIWRIEHLRKEATNPFRAYKVVRDRITGASTMFENTIDGWGHALNDLGYLTELGGGISDAAESVKYQAWDLADKARRDDPEFVDDVADGVLGASADALTGYVWGKALRALPDVRSTKVGRADGPDVPDGPRTPDAPDTPSAPDGPDGPSGARGGDRGGDGPGDLDDGLAKPNMADPPGSPVGPAAVTKTLVDWLNEWRWYLRDSRYWGAGGKRVRTAEPLPGTVPVAVQQHWHSCGFASLRSALIAATGAAPDSIVMRVVAKGLGIWEGTGINIFDFRKITRKLAILGLVDDVTTTVYKLGSVGTPFQDLRTLFRRTKNELILRVGWRPLPDGTPGGGHFVRVEAIDGDWVQLSDPMLPLRLSIRVPREAIDALGTHAIGISRP